MGIFFLLNHQVLEDKSFKKFATYTNFYFCHKVLAQIRVTNHLLVWVCACILDAIFKRQWLIITIVSLVVGNFWRIKPSKHENGVKLWNLYWRISNFRPRQAYHQNLLFQIRSWQVFPRYFTHTFTFIITVPLFIKNGIQYDLPVSNLRLVPDISQILMTHGNKLLPHYLYPNH